MINKSDFRRSAEILINFSLLLAKLNIVNYEAVSSISVLLISYNRQLHRDTFRFLCDTIQILQIYRAIEPRPRKYLRKYIIKLFRLHRRLRGDYIDDRVVITKLITYTSFRLWTQSHCGTKRCLILDIRSNVIAASGLYRAIFPLLLLRSPQKFS